MLSRIGDAPGQVFALGREGGGLARRQAPLVCLEDPHGDDTAVVRNDGFGNLEGASRPGDDDGSPGTDDDGVWMGLLQG